MLGRDQLRQATEAIERFVRGPSCLDDDYYQLEAFRCTTATYDHLQDSDSTVRELGLLAQNAAFHQVLAGERRLTRWALGHHPLPRLVTHPARFERSRGYVSSCMRHTHRVIPLMLSTQHPPSIMIAAPPAGYPLEKALLNLVSTVCDAGDALGLMLFYILHSLPLLFLFRPEVPLSAHAAVVRLVRKYAAPFSCPIWDCHIALLDAQLHLKMAVLEGQQQQQQQQRSQQQLICPEVARLLSEAERPLTFETLEQLRVAMVRAELLTARGQTSAATQHVHAALTRIPEADQTDFEHVALAKRMLSELGQSTAGLSEHSTALQQACSRSLCCSICSSPVPLEDTIGP